MKTKKIAALLLSSVMLVSSFTTDTFAEEIFCDAEQVVFEESDVEEIVGESVETVEDSDINLDSVTLFEEETVADFELDTTSELQNELKEPVLYFNQKAVSKFIKSEVFTNALYYETTGDISYSSSDTSVAKVDSKTGAVSVQGAGTTVITAKSAESKEYASGAASYTLTVEGMKKPTLHFPQKTVTQTMGSEKFINTFYTETDGDISFSSSDESVATVDASTGEVTIKAIGTTVITATAEEGYYYEKSSASYTLIVENKKVPILYFDKEVCNKVLGCSKFTNALYYETDGEREFSSSDTNVAKVDAKSGEVTIVGIGEATITVTTKETDRFVAGKVSYTIKVVGKKDPILYFKPEEVQKKLGDKSFINPLWFETDGAGEFSSSNTDVARVDKTTGEVTIVGEGRTKIYIRSEETENYNAGSAYYILAVGVPVKQGMTIKENPYVGTYDGKAIEKELITVTEPSEDYEIYYSDGKELTYSNYKKDGMKSIPKLVTTGNYKVYYYVTCIGYYDQNGSVSVQIKPKSIEKKDCTLKYTSLTYTGTERKPQVTVTGLTEGKDYTVTYENNINVGTATAHVTGIGNYGGQVDLQFKIIQKTQKVSLTETKISKYYVYGSTFQISASTSGNGKLSYTSSDQTVVTVSSTGKVTIKGPGAAKITVKAATTSTYKAASASVIVKILPKKNSVKAVSSKKGTITCNWSRGEKVSGYQLQYSTSSDFSTCKNLAFYSSSTISRTISGLTSKKTYYVRIRNFKTTGSSKVFGAWSSVYKVTVK
ncbi:Ig-like domain-containing protein [Anaerostipes sp.]|uniref:Ig-like domain-containing protein n=1 Tax=Anaerostipes sp. TaxID=1872530 RepID=UPI0025851F08|nr:Ig-like domain-containing protein [Anaerostipes sp.]MCI5623736.1 Ig-like domain-containing protein [Anaerostipes sp.]